MVNFTFMKVCLLPGKWTNKPGLSEGKSYYAIGYDEKNAVVWLINDNEKFDNVPFDAVKFNGFVFWPSNEWMDKKDAQIARLERELAELTKSFAYVASIETVPKGSETTRDTKVVGDTKVAKKTTTR